MKFDLFFFLKQKSKTLSPFLRGEKLTAVVVTHLDRVKLKEGFGAVAVVFPPIFN